MEEDRVAEIVEELAEEVAVEAEPVEEKNTKAAIDVNSADYEVLEALPYIGPIYAQRIIEYREQHGIFYSLDDLKKVRGIGDFVLSKLEGTLTVVVPEGVEIPLAEPAPSEDGAELADAVEEPRVDELEEPIEEAEFGEEPFDEDEVVEEPVAAVEEEAEEEKPEPLFKPIPEEKPAPPAPQPAPPPTVVERGPDMWVIVGTAIAGALLGAALALFLIRNYNGALDFRQSPHMQQLQNQVTALTEQQTNIRAQQDAVMGQIDTLAEQMTNMSQSLDTTVSEIQGSITSLETEISGLELQATSLETDVAVLSDSVKVVGELGGEVEHLSDSVSVLADQTVKVQDGLKELDGSVDTLQQDTNNFKDFLSALRDTLNSMMGGAGEQ